MSRPPERSWMLATLIASSAQALEPNAPVAAAAAVACKNLLRLTLIALLLVVADYVIRPDIFFKTDAPIVYFRSTMFHPFRHDRSCEPGAVDHRNILKSSQRGMAAVPVGNALVCISGRHQAGFIEMAANKLECDRTATFGKAARKGNGWTSRHVEGAAEAEQPR